MQGAEQFPSQRGPSDALFHGPGAIDHEHEFLPFGVRAEERGARALSSFVGVRCGSFAGAVESTAAEHSDSGLFESGVRARQWSVSERHEWECIGRGWGGDRGGVGCGGLGRGGFRIGGWQCCVQFELGQRFRIPVTGIGHQERHALEGVPLAEEHQKRHGQHECRVDADADGEGREGLDPFAIGSRRVGNRTRSQGHFRFRVGLVGLGMNR